MAVAVIAMSAGYLRCSEACSARVGDYGPVKVTANLSNTSKAFGVFTLAKTKAGRSQSALIRDRLVHDLLVAQQKLAKVRNYTFLFDMTSTTFRHRFATFLRAYQLDGESFPKWVPHSLRHGAATYDYIRGIPFADIKARGRWANDRVVHIYLQSGEIALNRLKLPKLPKHKPLPKLCNTLRKIVKKQRLRELYLTGLENKGLISLTRAN